MNPKKDKNKIGFVKHVFSDSQSDKNNILQLKILIYGIFKISKGKDH